MNYRSEGSSSQLTETTEKPFCFHRRRSSHSPIPEFPPLFQVTSEGISFSFDRKIKKLEQVLCNRRCSAMFPRDVAVQLLHSRLHSRCFTDFFSGRSCILFLSINLTNLQLWSNLCFIFSNTGLSFLRKFELWEFKRNKKSVKMFIWEKCVYWGVFQLSNICNPTSQISPVLLHKHVEAVKKGFLRLYLYR